MCSNYIKTDRPPQKNVLLFYVKDYWLKGQKKKFEIYKNLKLINKNVMSSIRYFNPRANVIGD